MVESRTALRHLDPAEFRQIRELVRAACGIKLTDDTREMVERRLGDRLEALALADFAAYCRYLRDPATGKTEIELATELLATNETYFFREFSQLRALERDVLPELQRAARIKRSLTIWSAGCSTGEEAYTVAILIARSELFAGWNVRVIGTDISRRVLHMARKAAYRGASFRAMPLEYERHFVDAPDGKTLVPEVRSMCQFAQSNLLDPAAVVMVGRVDAILCRNVLIYFDDDARKRALAIFYERLQPGGYLLLGHSESLLLSNSPFQLAHLSGELVYRKPPAVSGRQGQP